MTTLLLALATAAAWGVALVLRRSRPGHSDRLAHGVGQALLVVVAPVLTLLTLASALQH